MCQKNFLLHSDIYTHLPTLFLAFSVRAQKYSTCIWFNQWCSLRRMKYYIIIAHHRHTNITNKTNYGRHTVLTQHSPSPSKSPCHSSQFSIEKQKRTLFYALNNYTNSPYFNPLTPGAFCQKCIFLDILVIFRLDLSQISFNLVENAFERDGRVLWHFGSGVRRNQDFEIGREGDLCL